MEFPFKNNIEINVLWCIPWVFCTLGSSDLIDRSYVRFHNTADNFRLHACASCFNFLFYFLNPRLNTSNDDPQLAFIYNGNLINLKSWDFRNHSVQSSVCSYLSNDECQRWLSCCQSADSCCERQLSLPAEVNNTCGRIDRYKQYSISIRTCVL